MLVGRHQPCIRFAKGVPDNLEEVFALLEHKLQQQLVSAKEQQQQQRCPSAARLDGSTKQPGSTTQRQAANMWDADVAKWCRRYCSKLHELEEAALAVAKRLADAHNPA